MRITVKDIKLLFNRTIYGGGYNKWVESITLGKKDEKDDETYLRAPKNMNNQNSPHPFYQKFYEETKLLIDTIYNSNSAIADLVCQNIPSDPKREWERKSRTMSYFCGVVENEITYQAYTYLYNNGYYGFFTFYCVIFTHILSDGFKIGKIFFICGLTHFILLAIHIRIVGCPFF